jgi:hypothetical protein
MLEPRHHRFEHATVETHGMAARPQRQPVQIDSAVDVLRISLGQRLAVRANWAGRRKRRDARSVRRAGATQPSAVCRVGR